MPRSYYAEDNFGNQPDKWTYSAINDLEEYYGSHINLTQAITDKALKAMDYPIEKGEPFYLYMAHFGVHTPIHPEPQYFQKYLDAGQEERTAMYSSMVESVDESLGQIMDYLDRKGVADNTVIIFYSDNGGHSLNTAKNSVPHTFNAPLREGKGSVYEGGVRVPMMVYWPGKTEAGMRINTPVTFLSAIRKGDWKLVYRMHDGRLELYNLKKDLGEKNDVSAMHPKIVRELAAELSDTLREWEAPMPLVKATGKLVPMPDELF